MNTENKLTAQVTGTRKFNVVVEIPNTITLTKDDDYYFYDSVLKKEKHLGLWNANLDFIRDQLPSLEDELEIVKEYINAGKISDFHCNGLFSPQSVKWEA